MGQGFRAAQAFVEVTADLDDGPILSRANRAAHQVEDEFSRATMRAGETIAETLARAGDRGGDGLVRGMDGKLRDARGRFAKSIGGIGSESGSLFADTFGKGFMRTMRVVGNPYVLAALTPAIVGAAPFLGATLAAGIVGGTTLAAIGGGIALAVRDPEIKHAAAQTGRVIMDGLEGAAEPFKGELLQAFREGERAFGRWEPWVRRIGTASAQGVMPLVRGVTGLVDRALPGMTRAIERAYPAFVAIERGLRGIGADVGKLFDDLSDNGAEMGMALTGVFALIRGSIQTVGMVVNGLTEAFGWMMDRVYQIGELFQTWGRAAQGLPGPLGEAADGMLRIGDHIMSGKPQWDQWKASATGAVLGTADATSKLDERQRLLNQSMGATVREAGSLSAAFQLLNGAALTAREAESQYQAAIDNVTASIKANGKTLDLNTEKGRANDQAIRNLITSIDRKAQATYDETAATKGTAAAEQAATRVYEQGRAQLVKNLTQILGNATAAEALADEIMGIPKTWGTKVSAETRDASGKITSFKKQVQNLDGTVATVTVRVTTKGDHYIPGVGTQLKGLARGGRITEGSGFRDDVPRLLMRDEFVVRKTSVRALERRFGPDIMEWLNNADRPGHRPIGERPSPGTPFPGHDRPALDASVAAIAGANRYPNYQTPQPRVFQFGPGSIVLDASKIRNVADLADMLDDLVPASRASTAATPTGGW